MEVTKVYIGAYSLHFYVSLTCDSCEDAQDFIRLKLIMDENSTLRKQESKVIDLKNIGNKKPWVQHSINFTAKVEQNLKVIFKFCN